MKKGIAEEWGVVGVVFVLGMVISYGVLKWSAYLSLLVGVVLAGLTWYFTKRKE